MNMPRVKYEQLATLPDGRPITLRWRLTLERYEASQGGPGWGVADADLEGFHLNRRDFALGEQARPLIEEVGGEGWLNEREEEVLALETDTLETLLNNDYGGPE